MSTFAIRVGTVEIDDNADPNQVMQTLTLDFATDAADGLVRISRGTGFIRWPASFLALNSPVLSALDEVVSEEESPPEDRAGFKVELGDGDGNDWNFVEYNDNNDPGTTAGSGSTTIGGQLGTSNQGGTIPLEFGTVKGLIAYIEGSY